MSKILATLVACDHAVNNGKWNLIGVFDAMFAPAFPVAIPPFYVFLRLSSVPVDREFEIKIQLGRTLFDEDGVGGGVVWTQAIKMTVPPEAVKAHKPSLEMAVLGAHIEGDSARQIVIPEPGVYDLEVFVDDNLCGHVTLMFAALPTGDAP